MRTLEIKVYNFSELNDNAKEFAINEYRNSNYDLGSHWQDENLNTILKGLEHFDCELRNYQIDYTGYQTYYKLWCANEYDEIKGIELKELLEENFGRIFSKYQNKYIDLFDKNNDCPITGYCADYEFLKPIYDFLDKPCEHTNFEELMKECIENVLSYMQKDYEYQISNEYISELLIDNDYNFTKDGRIFEY